MKQKEPKCKPDGYPGRHSLKDCGYSMIPGYKQYECETCKRWFFRPEKEEAPNPSR